MRRYWWDQMCLDGWLQGQRVLAGSGRDMQFAQHVARERAKVRGARQRLTIEHPIHQLCPVFYVQDAPEQVAEPCS